MLKNRLMGPGCGSDDDELLADSWGFFCCDGAASPKSELPCPSKREPRRCCFSRKRPDLEVVILRVKPPSVCEAAALGLSGAAADACCCWVVLLICLSSR